MQPNRLGLAANAPSGVCPSACSKANFAFVGSISGGITDSFLNELLSACGNVKSFKRLITPANKPQGFGFAEFEDPDGALRATTLLNNVELPALEDGCVNKKLLIKGDEKTKMFLEAYQAQRMQTNADEEATQKAKIRVIELINDINRVSQEAANNGLLDKERYVIPPHLHDLQEADLPETQRGLVISEIAQFRERAAKREREKLRDVRAAVPNLSAVASPSGPKVREWGKAQGTAETRESTAFGQDPQQGFSKPVSFVKAGSRERDDERQLPGKTTKTDEELEQERKDARRRDEDNSFRDRERRYEPRERNRIQALERAIARDRATGEAEERDRGEMRARLDIWDDDESDELFYTDRARWRTQRVRRLVAEEAADSEMRAYEAREAENLRRESEAFLARQMDELQALAEEQRKAGMLLDDGAPVRLNVSLSTAAPKADAAPTKEKAPAPGVFGAEEEEEEATRKRKVPLQLLDFSAAHDIEKAKERLEHIKASVPNERETLFKSKVRWDAVTEQMIDRKLEPLVKKLMVKYLGELDDDDVVMYVIEHIKDHKSPAKLVEGLEPVLDEEAVEFTIAVWRQVIFESMAYGEGLHTERMMVEG
ncbi:hypothetical protein B0F90DRAFT_825308 [Multifurca ochricompacta]|uniref:PWI domain-containing protein n=1 Tax=Multifurca ochricompacta TaxID=376703 RepID=A0AAD4QM48_9AGAM|nr:hypothetical protein B0F90DRAFT_825308 [Multifurca ochricompacta]